MGQCYRKEQPRPGLGPPGSPRQRVPRYLTTRLMTEQILDEYLLALHRGFGPLYYGIMGGAALIQYGRDRRTSDVDVIVPEHILDMAMVQVVESNVGIVRLDSGCLGYLASDGRCYGLDVEADTAIGQVFRHNVDTVTPEGTGVRFVNVVFLLNTKAHAYMRRDSSLKKMKDGGDIVFILDYMLRHSMRAGREECRWVVDYRFWTDFTRLYPLQKAKLTAIGLQRDPIPGSSTGAVPRLAPGRLSLRGDSTGPVLRLGPARQSSGSVRGSSPRSWMGRQSSGGSIRGASPVSGPERQSSGGSSSRRRSSSSSDSSQRSATGRRSSGGNSTWSTRVAYKSHERSC